MFGLVGDGVVSGGILFAGGVMIYVSSMVYSSGTVVDFLFILLLIERIDILVDKFSLPLTNY